jgi:MYXO-CTERM domain-containing protein
MTTLNGADVALMVVPEPTAGLAAGVIGFAGLVVRRTRPRRVK